MQRDWLDYAKTLREGQSGRIDHDCGGGRTLKVAHNDRGWNCFCFRCGETDFVPHSTESLAEKMARISRQYDIGKRAERSANLPGPKSLDPRDWPKGRAAWLYKVGMSRPEVMRLGIYHHEPTDRVVIPIAGRYWQARGFDPNLPKYLNPKVDRAGLVSEHGTGTVLVLTEDYLSAWRVSRITVAWALLGTKADDLVLARVAAWPGPVVIWLDGDKAGRQGASQIAYKLGMLRDDTRVVFSERDPKLLSLAEIKEKLFG